MDIFVCSKCGFIAFGQAPDICPVCGAKKQAFEQDNNAIRKPQDQNNLNELEKKHIPRINIERQCGLVGEGCVDVHIKIGEILHPMQTNHYIMYIDAYLDDNFLCRYHLMPDKINPVLGIHLKVSEGKLTVIENCNLHGRWMAEANL